ncbi:MAG: hypothetical protein OCU12_06315 [Methanophagales archaeon]|nr:hypothetical protein [Methanophagales archaeon]
MRFGTGVHAKHLSLMRWHMIITSLSCAFTGMEVRQLLYITRRGTVRHPPAPR